MSGPREKTPISEEMLASAFPVVRRAEAVREQTARILKSEPFLRAPRMQCFLTFVVEETLAGRSELLKEYTIALKVFGKAPDFDPRVCPIVRVEAGRLRRLLSQHYFENQSDHVLIEIPRGTYVPTFRFSSVLNQPISAQRGLSNQRAPLVAEQTLPSDAILGWHSSRGRSPVTVMSCAVPDQAHLYNATNANRILEFLSTFQRQCTLIAARYGGEILSEAGDRILVYIWSEHAEENSAERALSAALDILSALGDPLSGEPAGVRIGIATGNVDATFSTIGSIIKPSSFLSIAETPILAVRILHGSPPNRITIDEDTRRMLRAAAGLVNVGWLEKAQGERILLWQIIPDVAHQETLGVTPSFYRSAHPRLHDKYSRCQHEGIYNNVYPVIGGQSITQYRTALETVRKLPEAKEKWHRELKLLTNLGNVIRTARGYGDEELLPIYERARALCQKLGRREELADALFGQWTLAAGQAHWSEAEVLANQFAGMSLDADTSGQMSVEAYRLLAANKLYAGKFIAARSHFERCLSLYDVKSHGPRFGYDPGASSAAYLSWTLWHLGLEAEASNMAAEALQLAEAKNHTPTMALVLTYVAFFEVYRGKVDAVLAYTDRLIALCSESDYRHWLAFGIVCSEWAKCRRDHDESHLETLLSAIKQHRQLWGGYFTPGLMLLAADLCRHLGKPAQGLRIATAAQRFVSSHGERLWEAECDRLIGEILLLRRAPSIPAAERRFRKAIRTAHRQGSFSLEKRAVQSLRQLKQLPGI